MNLPLTGQTINLYSKSGEQLATGYQRVVVGDRGPYVEFTQAELITKNFIIPQNAAWRITHKNCFYLEYRSKSDNVKLYYQRKTVSYADYKIGFFYMSPDDLKT